VAEDLLELIVTDAESLMDCVAHLQTVEVFGFDTEFVGEDSYHPELCLVQVATEERRYLLDPLALDSLTPFWNIVTDPAKCVIVHAGREEVRMCKHFSGQVPGNLFDVQIAAGLLGLGYPLGHAALVQQTLHAQLSKGETLTDWRKRPLTAAQIRYAYDDVRYLIPLWKKLTARLRERNRLEWAQEEFATFLEKSCGDSPTTERWRKLRGLGSFDRRKLAVVRALYQWREEQAARLNRPSRFVLRDDLLIEAAKWNPASDRDFQQLRGMPKTDLAMLSQLIESARQTPLADCPEAVERDIETPQQTLITTLLNAVLNDFCRQSSLTPALVATMSDLRALVRSQMLGESFGSESALGRGWRREAVLPELLLMLQGRKSIRIANLRAESPLEYCDT